MQVGLIADNEILEAFKGDKLNLVSPVTLKQTLAYIFTLIGLTKYPDENEFAIIEDYIRTSYPKFTLQEFRIAFKMATQGKLDCHVDHYEKFSPKFISQVMNAYKGKANDIRKMLQYKQVEELPVPKLTDDQIVEFSKKDWLESKKDDFNRLFNADRVFDILYKRGDIKINDETIAETLKIVRADNLYKLNKLSVLEAKEFNKKIKDEDYLETQCKKLTIVRYYESLSD